MLDYPDSVVEQVAEIFKAFSQPTRLKIIRRLHKGPATVTQLHEAVGSSQANISKHLQILKNQSIVEVESHGTSREYRLADEDVSQICESVCSYFEDRLSERSDLLNQS